jgi:ComF family protein
MLEQTYLKDFVHLLFPEYCPGCSGHLGKHEKLICTSCLLKLPKANIARMKDNPVEKLFWGRIEIERAAAFLQFSKGGMTQRLLHDLKYRGNQDLGEKLGRLMADDLMESGWSDDVDEIIPVPLHPRKMKLRGFNQAKCIADGMSEIWKKPVSTGNLIRKIHNPTQTKKSRFARWQNTSNIFGVKDSGEFEGKHLVLVDDVVTTGSTIEACAMQLNKIDGVKVSVASVAFPMN